MQVYNFYTHMGIFAPI